MRPLQPDDRQSCWTLATQITSLQKISVKEEKFEASMSVAWRTFRAGTKVSPAGLWHGTPSCECNTGRQSNLETVMWAAIL